MFLLEINEFNADLLKLAAEQLRLKNIKRLTQLRHTHTTTDDKEERFGLDPWVQWVSIHTGKTSGEHQVQHLGDVPNLNDPQIWEKLGAQGVRCGVWGVMNAGIGQAKNCEFFLPDPWTYSEKAYPNELNDLLAFPKYFSQNYCDLDKVKAFKSLLSLMGFCLRPSVFFSLLPIAPTLINHLLRYGFKEYLLFVLFDLVNAKLFSLYYKKTSPDFSVLFLNSIAHLQHHKWTIKDGLSEEMIIAFKVFDKALAILFKTVGDEDILITNSFSQFCSIDQNEFLYRQKNPEKFLKSANIPFVKVEQAMTNDGHIFFESADQATKIAEVLRQATVSGKPAFHVDYDLRTPEKLFFQVIIWDKQNTSAVMQINGKELNFLGNFEEITQRSGSHQQNGDIYTNAFELPPCIYNHEIYNIILERYNVTS